MKIILVLIFIVSLLNSCSSGVKVKNTLRVNRDVSVSYGSVKDKAYKASQVIDIQSDPMLVESPGNISVLVVPISSTTKAVELNMKELTKKTFSNKMKTIYDKDLTYVFSKVFSIQKDLQENSAKDALTKLQGLKKEFPELTYLYFLEASIHYIMGDTKKTKSLLELALSKYPDNEDALSLYASLLSKGEPNRFLAGEKK